MDRPKSQSPKRASTQRRKQRRAQRGEAHASASLRSLRPVRDKRTRPPNQADAPWVAILRWNRSTAGTAAGTHGAGQAWRAGGWTRRAGLGRGPFSRVCRATDQGASLSCQDGWRGIPCHVTGQRPRSSPRHPPAAPPYMARHMRFAAPWQ